MRDTCTNCGKWKGLHKWDTMQCPFSEKEDNLFLANQFYAEENAELAALRAERDELREALIKAESALTYAFWDGTFDDTHTNIDVMNARDNARAVLAKYQEAK